MATVMDGLLSKFFATQTPRQEVLYKIFFLCVLAASWLSPVYPGWGIIFFWHTYRE